MRRIYDDDFLAAMVAAGLAQPKVETEILPDELEARMEAIEKALDEPGVKEVRIFRIPNANPRRRFPVPPRNLHK